MSPGGLGFRARSGWSVHCPQVVGALSSAGFRWSGHCPRKRPEGELRGQTGWGLGRHRWLQPRWGPVSPFVRRPAIKQQNRVKEKHLLTLDWADWKVPLAPEGRLIEHKWNGRWSRRDGSRAEQRLTRLNETSSPPFFYVENPSARLVSRMDSTTTERSENQNGLTNKPTTGPNSMEAPLRHERPGDSRSHSNVTGRGPLLRLQRESPLILGWAWPSPQTAARELSQP